jgi:DMSO/TMAO reductase YedYZ molybdopterin-dependent catalytic subunit
MVEFDALIACAGSSPGGAGLGQARWRGVPLESILAEIALLPGADYAHLHAADGYNTCLRLDQLRRATLVYAMDGEPLAVEHGYPVRLVLPGHYGYKMPKWIQRIVLADVPLTGFWERRGWSQNGAIQPVAAFSTPQDQAEISGQVALQGYAYGSQPMAAVELSDDGGPWMPATMAQDSPATAAQWALDWRPAQPGSYRLSVRARDLGGGTQAEPLHSIVLHIG